MIVKQYIQIQSLIDFIKRSNIIAYDVETDGLNVRKNRIIGFGLANEKLETFYIPLWYWDTASEKLIRTSIQKTQFIPILELLKSKKVIAHNSYFDLETTRYNFDIDLWDSLYLDTICLKHTVSEVPPFGLKPIAKMLWGADELKEKEEMDASIKANGGSKGEIWKADMDIIGKYCQQDVALTIRVMQHYIAILKQEGLENLFFKDEVMPLYRLVTRSMQSGGIPLDVDLLVKTKAEIEQDINRIEDEIQIEIKSYTTNKFKEYYLNKNFVPSNKGEFAQVLLEVIQAPILKNKSGKYKLGAKDLAPLKGTPVGDYLVSNMPLDPYVLKLVQEKMWDRTSQRYMFNLSSKHHLKKLFFDYMKETPISKTDKGAPQVDDLFLSKMAEKYNWVKKLQVYNKLNKILGTYINRFLNEQENGIFYPDFQQHGTVTARYASDLQQLPRKLEGNDVIAKYTNILRPCLIAREGHKLVGADFSQLEITVFADDANEPTLLNMIRNKEDFYSRVAIDIYNLSNKYSANKKADNFLKKINPELRQKMKSVALGIRYGLESFKLHHDLKITQEEAELIIHNYFNAYPNLKSRMDELIESVKKFGFVATKVGRKRRLPEIQKFILEYGEENLNALELYKNYSGTDKYQMIRELRKAIHNKLNAALNFPIQSMAASIVNRAAIKIMEDFKSGGLSAYICGQIHDEILVRCPEIEVDKVMKIVQNRMENTTKLNVPLEAIPQSGDNYGQIK